MPLFDEMDEIADECRAHPDHIEADDRIAFRDLQKKRQPKLDLVEFNELFELWRDRYRARREARRAEVPKLCQERDALLNERVVAPAGELPRIDARLEEIADTLAVATFL